MKNRYNFDFSINRRLTHSYKWDVDCKTISLSIADTDFLVPKEISDAIKKRSDLGTYGYTYVPNEYYDAYIYWWKNRHNTLLKREWFTFSTSVVASIDVIIKRLSKENDGVSLFSPNYNVFYNCILNNHRVIKEVPLIYKEDYEIDFSLLEEALKESKIFILCNPHNPIGRRFSEEEIIRIIDLCKKYDVYLISDEIHADLDYNEERYVPLLKVSDHEKGITLVALIVTIIVLLILAGVTVATLTGDNGLINKSGEAKAATENSALREELEVAVLSSFKKGSLKYNLLKEKLDKIQGLTYVTENPTSLPLRVKLKDQEFKIRSDGSIINGFEAIPG